jgi:predicted Zn-dependent protease
LGTPEELQPTGTVAVNRVFPLFAFCLAVVPPSVALAGDPTAQNSMFLPQGKSQVMQSLEAKRNARCAAIYGPGYGALGDSDTCIKVGGRVGISVGGSTKQNRLILVPSPGIGAPAPALGGRPVAVVRGKSGIGTATSAELYVTTHTPTEYGDISTHVSVGGVRASGAYRTAPDYVR